MLPRLRAALIALDDLGRILLLKHMRPHGQYWVLPGGGVDAGESVESALVREISEELGAKVRPEKLVAIGELMTGERHVVDFFFTGALDRQTGFVVKHEEGIGEARWVEPSRMHELKVLPPEIVPILEEIATGWTGNAKYIGKYKMQSET
jgi:ADP-ribose pyrophosphatase YjhB (NUDIX family)